jgi:hypothetical protein
VRQIHSGSTSFCFILPQSITIRTFRATSRLLRSIESVNVLKTFSSPVGIPQKIVSVVVLTLLVGKRAFAICPILTNKSALGRQLPSPDMCMFAFLFTVLTLVSQPESTCYLFHRKVGQVCSGRRICESRFRPLCRPGHYGRRISLESLTLDRGHWCGTSI